jgi:hypothetical protein
VGDYFQNIVDVEATDEEAGPLGERLLRWLLESGIVVDTPADNVLGAELGYGPGPRYMAAVTAPDESMLRLRTNGLHLIDGRNIYHCGQEGCRPGGLPVVRTAGRAAEPGDVPYERPVGPLVRIIRSLAGRRRR